MAQENISGKMAQFMKDNFAKDFEQEKGPSKTKEDFISKEIFWRKSLTVFAQSLMKMVRLMKARWKTAKEMEKAH